MKIAWHIMGRHKAILNPCMLMAAFTGQASAAEIWFSPDALERNGRNAGTVDLRHFERGGQLPGTYRVDVYVNGIYHGTGNYTFIATQKDGLQPLITKSILRSMGAKTQAFPALAELDEATPFSDISSYIPNAYSALHFEQQRLDISIPQAAMDFQARGAIDPARWDQGVPTAFVGYNMTGSRTWLRKIGQTRDNYFLSTQSGLNLGAWRLRNYSTYTDNDRSHTFKSINTYLSRDIQALRGQLVLGESSTPSEIFDSVTFRGAKLVSEDAMLPDSLRGFAPVVRGIAQSNAMVTVRQNGVIIYQTYVAPGAFEIRDLFPTSSSGDLEVTVREADGSERRFTQPFSSVPGMLREGNVKYAVVAGKYRSQRDNAREPGFGMATFSYGVSNYLTLYGGVLGAGSYTSMAAGAGIGLGQFGSLSLDITDAHAELHNGDKKHGQSYRMQYAKTLTQTDTTLTLASYRYSTEGFYTFQEANDFDTYIVNKRSRFQITLSQSLGKAGNLYLSAYQQNYWQGNHYDRTVNIGWNGSYRRISYALNYSLTQNANNGRTDRQVSFFVQIPLDGKLKNSWAHAGSTITQHNGTTSQVGLSGTALTDNNLDYSLNQGYASRSNSANGNLNARYRGAMGEISAGYNYDTNSRQLNFGLQGGIFAHPYGLTLSQQPGETMALVRMPEASNVKINNQTGVSTDWRGYAVVPYLSAYRSNPVSADPQSLTEDVELESTLQEVVPTRGALVLADFKARIGTRALFTLTHHGAPVPFGATVKVVGEDNTSIVGDRGLVYLSGLTATGTLEVDWGNNTCQTEFTIPPDNTGIRQSNLTCK